MSSNFLATTTPRHYIVQAIRRMEALGGTPVEIDFGPFWCRELLYDGPWVAERVSGCGIRQQEADSILPVTRDSQPGEWILGRRRVCRAI